MFRLSAAAEADIVDILAWTHGHFGTKARLRYERLIATALRNVAIDPHRLGCIKRPELGQGVRSYHLRHCRDQARHPRPAPHLPAGIFSPPGGEKRTR
ncbi:type II toxin-antitoxin system RelE/ParE family toxin [Rhizobium sp. PP-CC-3G-465]|uniref:type II toxin-antitoxin system RelE/ParE family toxin n=1 Tax=Rhizobium sp. PP-CC-3G-465 TaxID=2135648 RepID=UPI00104FD0E9|nr:ParE-like toxin of type II ParDE toxin-antitoxin system [Rhizobium sp. PP-CC-3G-465]